MVVVEPLQSTVSSSKNALVLSVGIPTKKTINALLERRGFEPWSLSLSRGSGGFFSFSFFLFVTKIYRLIVSRAWTGL